MKQSALAIMIVLACGCAQTSVSQPTSDSYTVIWDIKKADDQHQYVRFATGHGPVSCSIVHSAGCTHPECVAARNKATAD
jgi:hypothetical protein